MMIRKCFMPSWTRSSAERSGRSWDLCSWACTSPIRCCPRCKNTRAGVIRRRVYLACWEDGEELRRSLDGRPLYLELGGL